MRWLPLIALLVAGQVQAKSLPPQDECNASREFAPTWTRFQAAVKARNTRELLLLIAADVKTDFGGEAGKPTFVKFWELNGPKPSPLWKNFDAMIALGCAFDTDSATIPFLAARTPSEADAYASNVAIGTNINLRSAPNLTANTITRLNWDIVTEIDPPAKLSAKTGNEWAHVRTSNALTGFVARRYLRSPIDYRAIFQKHGRQWEMTMLVDGD